MESLQLNYLFNGTSRSQAGIKRNGEKKVKSFRKFVSSRKTDKNTRVSKKELWKNSKHPKKFKKKIQKIFTAKKNLEKFWKNSEALRELRKTKKN